MAIRTPPHVAPAVMPQPKMYRLRPGTCRSRAFSVLRFIRRASPCIRAPTPPCSTAMAFDLVQIRELAQLKEDENWSFRRFLKNSDFDPNDIDRRVFEITERVWTRIDCTSCANCCREIRPSFSDQDVTRLAARLGMERREFVATYLERTEIGDDNPWQTRTTPCPFLKENRCSVYDDRPADCRGYPYLYEPDFPARTIGMIGRAATCPIVYEVIEELKKSLTFRAMRP